MIRAGKIKNLDTKITFHLKNNGTFSNKILNNFEPLFDNFRTVCDYYCCQND